MLAFLCFLVGVLVLALCGASLSLFSAVLAFPCVHVGLLALPLCGAAPTFFAAAKKVGKESSFTPPALKRVPWPGGDRGASGIRFLAHSASVTRPSFFRRRYTRRSPAQKPSVFFGVSPRRSQRPSLRERTRWFSWQTRPRRT
ncbi:hypothetical protein F3J19_24585 [Burkholderia sp. Ax-1724]|nr:hypothetical protein [Burkholderia sp. Ax-1724]